MKKNFTLTAKIWRWGGGLASWHFIYVPRDLSEMLRHRFPSSAMIRCRYTLGETTWESTMFRNNRENNYLIPIKQKVRKQEGLMDGDEICIKIQILS